MKKAYLLSKKANGNLSKDDVVGIIVDEDKNLLGNHYSSNQQWLKIDLLNKIDPSQYEVINLIGEDIPEQFKDLI